jgi:Cu-Zn family superoxide dismutase
MTHGGLNTQVRHIGDFGNVESDDSGMIKASIEAPGLLLSGKNSIIGRAIVLHANEDDLGLGNAPTSKDTGNSGARIACGVIGIDKPES